MLFGGSAEEHWAWERLPELRPKSIGLRRFLGWAVENWAIESLDLGWSRGGLSW